MVETLVVCEAVVGALLLLLCCCCLCTLQSQQQRLSLVLRLARWPLSGAATSARSIPRKILVRERGVGPDFKAHMMQQMAAYASSNITTELIQKYLDENKQLILAILDNQNLGKLNDCAMYQAKLQQNLMYLAAIADAQPQGAHNPPQAAAPVPPSIQPAQHYLQQQQQHQQQQHLFMSQRNSIPQYLQQSQQASQQSFYTQQAMMSGEGSGLHMLSSERGMGDNGPQLSAGFSDGGGGGSTRDGNQSSLGLRGGGMHHGGGGGGGGGGGPDLGVSSPLGHRDGGSGQGGDDSEASYLKGSDASSL